MSKQVDESSEDWGCFILLVVAIVAGAVAVSSVASCEKATEKARYQYQTEIEKAKIERGIKP